MSVTRGRHRKKPRLALPRLATFGLGVVLAVLVSSSPMIVRSPAPAKAPTPAVATPRATPARAGERPNILLITTDDQNVDDLRWMPRTSRLLASAGTTFTHALSPHPLCCPARAEILTGQYAQNNGVQHNHGLYGGFPRLDVRRTVGPWLQREGYRTGFVGKFLNEYDGAVRPPGWDIWDPILTNWYSYFGTTFFAPRPGDRQAYSTDAISHRTVDYLRRLAAGSEPFFLWTSHVAPHATPNGAPSWGPPVTAPRDAHAFRQVPAWSPRSPSFGVPGVGGAGLVGGSGAWSDEFIQRFYTQRLRALQPVDRAVARALRLLRRLGELDRTYVFFASDNGFLLGEHAFIGKNVLYEENLAVPLLVRGPNVLDRLSPLPVTLADLAPTFLDIAGARARRSFDGVSFLPALRGRPLRWRDTQLIQTGRAVVAPDGSGGWTYRGVRTRRYTFGMRPGQRLLFDRRRDPAELHDVAGNPAYRSVLHELARRTRLLEDCAGSSCSRSFGPVGPPTRQVIDRG